VFSRYAGDVCYPGAKGVHRTNGVRSGRMGAFVSADRDEYVLMGAVLHWLRWLMESSG